MGETSRMNIVEFLEARIEENEADADYLLGREDDEANAYGEHFLAECAAKRAIIDLHGPVRDDGWKSGEANGYLWCGMCGSIDDSPEPFPCATLKAIAAVYADHPHYQQEWSA